MADITGDDGPNKINGTEDADTISGLAGDDILRGHGGGDTLIGGLGKDKLLGGDSDDTLRIDAADEIEAGEVYDGGDGDDALGGALVTGPADLSNVTIRSIEHLFGFADGVSLTAKQLDGFTGSINTGAITLTNGGTVDLSGIEVATGTFFLAEAGNNLTLNNAGTINGAGGNDKIMIVGSGTRVNLFGGAGDDILIGDGGNDFLAGGTGKDKLFGGDGDDFMMIDIAEIEPGEVYDGGAGTDRLAGPWLFDDAVDLSGVTIRSVEELQGFWKGVSLTAKQLGGLSSFIETGTITLTTGGKVDLSGSSVSTSTFNLAADGNNLTLNDQGGANYVVNGAGGNDKVTVVGGSAGTTLSGASGDDILRGGSGNDALIGGLGKDKLYGGDGNDRLDVNTADEIEAGEVYDGGDGTDTLHGDAMDPVDLSGVTIRSVENLNGFLGGVSLTAKQLDGFTGYINNTPLLTLTTGGKADLSGTQVVSPSTFNLAEAGNNLTLNDTGSSSYSVNGAGGNDKVTVVGGSAGATLSGAGGDDILIGGGGNDSLDGGEGNDVLRGGDGDNTMTGGAGNDRFAFRPDETESGTTQTITDFSGITAFGGGAGENDVMNFTSYGSGAYIDDAAFSSGGSLEVRFAGEETLEIDSNGDGTADFTVVVTGLESASQLVAGDFWFGA